jgi:pyruvate dehydrogenase E2 component (dihydrolipoamide acetyltransferase)
VQEPVAPVQPVAPVPPVAPVVSKPESALVKKASGEKVMVAAGPAIRRFAREVGVDLQTIQGSGEHGRIVREDVLKVVREGSRQGGGQSSDPAGSQSDGYGPVHIEKMPKIRQTIAKKMHESWTTCPRVTNFDDADVTALEEIRQNSKQEYAAGGIKLTSMPFLVKAVAMALKSHPVINASVDLEQGQIIYKDYVNVGIAIDTERGLVVPSLRNADNLGIPDVARQLGQLADNVRSGNFSIDDLRGGTFTISNLGAIGGTYSTPIINTPETAILLVGRSRKLPVVVGDEVKIRLMMPLSLSYDHRLIDGGAAARFLNEVIGYLEAPSRLLLAL